MKAVILAGGYGTRISEETGIRPKPMVEIGGKPILWHIMKVYSHYGINDFIICCGYKGELIKDYFANYHMRNADITLDLAKHSVEVHKNGAEDWKVTLVDTGEKTSKSGRLLKVKEYIGNETFCLTYGDGVSDVNIQKLIDFHNKKKVLATVTAVKSPGRFGAFSLQGRETQIKSFREKPIEEGVWINGGFFVLEPEVFGYIKDGSSDLEEAPMRNLAKKRQLVGYKHLGFWHPMDTLRDKNVLEQMWNDGNAPWKVWK
ncbi:glucose-1-phosphate cytidylyltransferase [Candidatus Woesebacteria bacterium RIFCSPLOWO2_01_FULL_37_19]|uniref:Glucose-1-phosphate cytidylyltransferase n=1 Tax=Candidatus Woesebacteria bacterium RIFCSPLOWO2_01_FULL_37_19 TaxID=1802514 RepID=A0A1F8B6G8_9BACT|nr:MAG: glucose-1-phosphate cytidylyltransferase [Candidatus Woesebacteria bacterium RIFCSPLOWO2_01_FULL_37_19]